MKGSREEVSTVAGRGGGARGRGLLWVFGGGPALSVMLSVLVHGGAMTLLLVTSFQERPTPPKILLPEGVAVAEVRLVERPTRPVTAQRAAWPERVPELPPVPLQVEPPPEPVPVLPERPAEPEPLPQPKVEIPPEPVAQTDEVPPETPTVATTVAAAEIVQEPIAAPTATPAPEDIPTRPVLPAPATIPLGPPLEPETTVAPSVSPGVRTGAKVVSWPTVRYPPSCRRRGEEGLVRLEVEVLADGRVGRITVLQRADSPKLDEAAIEAVRSATFAAATVDGRAVTATVIVPVRFELR